MNADHDNDDLFSPALRNSYSTKRKQKFHMRMLALLSVLFLTASISSIFLWHFADSELDSCQEKLAYLNMYSNYEGGRNDTDPPAEKVKFPESWSSIALQVLGSMNRSVDPCEDFYQYACGGWLASPAAEIPGDRSSWSRSFGVLGMKTEAIELSIARAGFPLLGLFYTACSNTSNVERLGHTPLLNTLSKIEKIRDTPSLTEVLAELWLDGVEPLFSFGAQADFKNPDMVMGVFDQGGLSLPVNYYTSNDSDARAAVFALQQLAFSLFKLMPEPFNLTPLASARSVIAFQTALANVSLSNVERRDPTNLYNPMPIEGLELLAKTVDFSDFLKRINVEFSSSLSPVIVQAPLFFGGLDYVLESTVNSSYLRNFIAFQYVSDNAGLLSSEFQDAVFEFKRVVSGVTERAKRDVHCVRMIDATDLGFAMGHIFVAQNFPPEAKNATQTLTTEILTAFASRLREVSWLDGVTRDRALEKLKKIQPKIGYPDTWPQYDDVHLHSDRHFENVRSLTRYSTAFAARQVNKPTDRSLWGMFPQTVNAYYDASTNQIVFPAAILRPPFYNIDAPEAMNYGGIGSVIGHELHHAFDDEGRRFDGDGRLAPWWENEVVERFEKAIACVAQLYSSFTVKAGNQTLNLNGNLTLGENLADMGGVTIAYAAYKGKKLANREFALSESLIEHAFDGLSSDQLYFVSWAQNECALTRDATTSARIATEPHSPAEARVLGPASQTVHFANTFKCARGSRYNPSKHCVVW
jgi:putative endopeptidase